MISRTQECTDELPRTNVGTVSLVRGCFEPSQPQRITSGLNTNFTLSPSYSFHKSSYHKSCFFSLFILRGHSTREPASSGPTQEPCVSHSQHRRKEKEREREREGWIEGRSPPTIYMLESVHILVCFRWCNKRIRCP